MTAKAVSALKRGERKRPYQHTVRSLADALALTEAERASFASAVPARDENVRASDAGTPPADLPAPATALVGRERDVEAVVGLIRHPENRLVTLTGPGGVGKTRLATEVARTLLAAGSFPDGVFFVVLAPLGDASLVLPTIAQALLDAGETEGLSSSASLRAYLRNKRPLLVLDNFERLLEAAPEVAALLEAFPDLAVLATSRAPLRVRGEREYPVAPLAVPDPARAPRLEDVVGAPAVELFVQRARQASPAFEPSEANAAAVAAICWRLDGLPLALELAAARMRFLGPTALLSRLDRALEASGGGTCPRGSGRCGPPSTGATSCSPSPRSTCSRGCRSLPAASPWRRPRPWARIRTTRTCWCSSEGWSSNPWSWQSPEGGRAALQDARAGQAVRAREAR